MTLELLMNGLLAAMDPFILLAVLFGVVFGLVVGVLPGLGPAAGVAILLPVVVGFDGTAAIAALAGVYYGAMFGGAVTSILLGIPGDAPSIMTVVDGYPLAKKGEGGPALAMSVFASFIGGLIGIVFLTVLSVQIAHAALLFGPTETTALMILALSLVTVLGNDNVGKAYASLLIGLWIGMIGLDAIVGLPRFTFSQSFLLDGLDFSVIAVGIFGLGEMLSSLGATAQAVRPPSLGLRALMPRLSDIIKCRVDLVRGSLIGVAVGVLPGVGATAATMFAYAAAKRFSKTPERFGQGAIEGVAAPEAANNSASYANMIPLFTLGIPGSATTAVLMGGLLMIGLQPGPMLFRDNPEFIWTVFGTFYIGNLLLVFITLALTPLLAASIFVPLAFLYPVILIIVVFGVFGIDYSMTNVFVVAAFGGLGYVMMKVNYPTVPLVLGIVLGPMLEKGLRRTLISSQGDLRVFVERPISLVFLLLTAALIIYPLASKYLSGRQKHPFSAQ